MTGILADYENLAMTSDDLALVAHFLDRRTYLHFNFLSVMCSSFYLPRPAAGDSWFSEVAFLLVAVGDTATIEVVYGKLYLDFIAREDLDVVHTHLAGNVGQDFVAVFELNLKHCVRKGFNNSSLKFNCILLSQDSSFRQVGSQTQMESLSTPMPFCKKQSQCPHMPKPRRCMFGRRRRAGRAPQDNSQLGRAPLLKRSEFAGRRPLNEPATLVKPQTRQLPHYRDEAMRSRPSGR